MAAAVVAAWVGEGWYLRSPAMMLVGMVLAVSVAAVLSPRTASERPDHDLDRRLRGRKAG
jgi:hypothetical protein